MNCFSQRSPRKKIRFRFENIWLKEPNFVADMTEAWDNIPPMYLIPKLIQVSSFMARCGRTFFHKFRYKVKERKCILDQLCELTDEDSVGKYLDAKDTSKSLLAQEESYWKQKAKVL